MSVEDSQDTAYSREQDILVQYRTLAGQADLSVVAAREALSDLTRQYERLVDDTKLLTSVGDRLQRKLKSANLMMREQAEEIKRVNATLQEKNVTLQLTIDELTRAKASRRATALVLVAAFVLFLVSELLEETADTYFASVVGSDWGNAVSWIFKIVLVLLFKPAEQLLERRILKNNQKRGSSDEEIAAKRQKLQDEQKQFEILDPVELAKKKRAEARKKARDEAMAREAVKSTATETEV
ncbi:MAG: hypothetical protein SFY70_07000 [Bacteroidia bacterium]|nr:hypothetical protein [Bacteroidia bacterium]